MKTSNQINDVPEPNEETLAAIDEVRSGKCDGIPVDISSDEAFIKSIIEK
jgi:hypothetical protein